MGVRGPVVTITLMEFLYRTVPSKIPFDFPLNTYLKTDGTSLLILFLVKNFEEKEIEMLKELRQSFFVKVMITTSPAFPIEIWSLIN